MKETRKITSLSDKMVAKRDIYDIEMFLWSGDEYKILTGSIDDIVRNIQKGLWFLKGEEITEISSTFIYSKRGYIKLFNLDMDLDEKLEILNSLFEKKD